MDANMIFLLSIFLFIIGLQLFTLVVIFNKRKQKENEYYTDYVYKNLIFRVFKPEFEYQAVGKVSVNKILDRGTLSQFYMWALIEQ